MTFKSFVNYKSMLIPYFSKKVLLCERKRHTDRGVSSTPSAVLSGGGGYPIPARGYPISGTPHPDLAGRGYHISGTPIWTWLGYPLICTWLGYPSLAGPGWDTPLLPGQVGYLSRWTSRRIHRHVSKHNLPSYYVSGR